MANSLSQKQGRVDRGRYVQRSVKTEKHRLVSNKDAASLSTASFSNSTQNSPLILSCFSCIIENVSHPFRDVAQLGRAHAWGAWGRRFKSCHPDRRKPAEKTSGWFFVFLPPRSISSIIMMLFPPTKSVQSASPPKRCSQRPYQCLLPSSQR